MEGHLRATEHAVYANGRLGLANRDTAGVTFTYELTDHLGNVRAVVDRKTLNAAAGGDTSGVSPEVAMMADYYPFGWEMPGRKRNEDDYRYGFNGKETDPETGWQDYGMRLYNPRVARFFRVDPLAKKYPLFSTYQFAGNRPVIAVDVDGLEPSFAHGTWHNPNDGDDYGIAALLPGLFGTYSSSATVINDWGGGLSSFDRNKAAIALAAEAYRNWDGKQTILLVGWSHGSNVKLREADRLVTFHGVPPHKIVVLMANAPNNDFQLSPEASDIFVIEVMPFEKDFMADLGEQWIDYPDLAPSLPRNDKHPDTKVLLRYTDMVTWEDGGLDDHHYGFHPSNRSQWWNQFIDLSSDFILNNSLW